MFKVEASAKGFFANTFLFMLIFSIPILGTTGMTAQRFGSVRMTNLFPPPIWEETFESKWYFLRFLSFGLATLLFCGLYWVGLKKRVNFEQKQNILQVNVNSPNSYIGCVQRNGSKECFLKLKDGTTILTFVSPREVNDLKSDCQYLNGVFECTASVNLKGRKVVLFKTFQKDLPSNRSKVITQNQENLNFYPKMLISSPLKEGETINIPTYI
jgi:hypothetical protein